MKKILLLAIASFLGTLNTSAQCTILSTQGYQVNITVAPISLTNLVTNGGGCTFQTVVQYNIQFSGTNIPSNMFTLQGNVFCAGQNRFYDLPNNGGSGTAISANGSAPFINGGCSAYNKNSCTSITVIIQGPGIPYQEIPCAISSLPVEIIGFNATKKERSIVLDWSTNSELNNDYFIIEHSSDGKIFEEIGTVKGQGTTSQKHDYSFEHFKPTFGVNYFRLSQVDNDGSRNYTNILMINNPFADVDYVIYPNPSNDGNVSLQINKGQYEELNYKVYSIYGDLLTQEPLVFNNATASLKLPTEKSTYFVEIRNGEQRIGFEKILVN